MMTKRQAEQIFKSGILPTLNRKDKPLLREVWNNWTDSLCKNGDITDSQYNRWQHPSFCK